MHNKSFSRTDIFCRCKIFPRVAALMHRSVIWASIARNPLKSTDTLTNCASYTAGFPMPQLLSLTSSRLANNQFSSRVSRKPPCAFASNSTSRHIYSMLLLVSMWFSMFENCHCCRVHARNQYTRTPQRPYIFCLGILWPFIDTSEHTFKCKQIY